MGRFDEVAGKLVQAQEDITNSLNAKKVGGGSLSKVKISEVAGYIDAIETGNPNPFTINVTTNGYPGYNGQIVKATQGEIVCQGTIQNNITNIPVPKAGTWNVTTDLPESSKGDVSFIDSQSIQLTVECTAKIQIYVPVDRRFAAYFTPLTITSPSGKQVYNQNVYTVSGTNFAVNCDSFGYYSIYSKDSHQQGSASGILSGGVNITENRTYKVCLLARGGTIFPEETFPGVNFDVTIYSNSKDLPIDPPEIFEDYPLSQPEEPTLEYLESLGKTEEEAQETLEVYRSERQRYLSYEEQGMESDEILAEMYSIPEAEVVGE